jgi:hypothetical protein
MQISFFDLHNLFVIEIFDINVSIRESVVMGTAMKNMVKMVAQIHQVIIMLGAITALSVLLLSCMNVTTIDQITTAKMNVCLRMKPTKYHLYSIVVAVVFSECVVHIPIVIVVSHSESPLFLGGVSEVITRPKKTMSCVMMQRQQNVVLSMDYVIPAALN